MDIRKIKKLIELVEESGISELEITEGEESVRIHRGGSSSSVQYAPQMMQAPMMGGGGGMPMVPSMQGGYLHMESAPLMIGPDGKVIKQKNGQSTLAKIQEIVMLE